MTKNKGVHCQYPMLDAAFDNASFIRGICRAQCDQQR